MAIPVDSDTRVSEAFVSAIERDVIINLAFVIFRVLLGATHACFFIRREYKHQIAFGLDLRSIQRADGCEQRLDIPRVVANAGRVNTSFANSGFDLETGLKDGVHVRVEDGDWTTTATFTHRN